MKEYPKIYVPFERAIEGDNRNKLIVGNWLKPEFEYLADNTWIWTEKVDGTNVRIHWDGHRVTYGGRTDDAQLSLKMVDYLRGFFTEGLFEQAFGSVAVTLYGEGVGPTIQKSSVYTLGGYEFILFDVLIDTWWLRRADLIDVAQKLGTLLVPVADICSLNQKVSMVSSVQPMSLFGDFPAEGFVGTPLIPLSNRAGERIIVKVKNKDFRHLRGAKA